MVLSKVGFFSPILFCVNIDDLLVKLSKCGVRCFIETNFVGALAYMNDIVLLAPSPSAMRKLLAVCESLLWITILYLTPANLIS
jgi:hypothetical protein